MPRLPEVVKQRAASAEERTAKAKSLRSSSQTSLSSNSTLLSSDFEFSPSPSPQPVPDPEPDPVELVYNIRYDAFRQAPRSTVLRQDVACTPLIDLPVTCPPLLVDGRMQLVQIPKWKRDMGFYWRSCSGGRTEVRWRSVHLPWRIWVERNLGDVGRWRELWIERS
jgi:hypothetical protein